MRMVWGESGGGGEFGMLPDPWNTSSPKQATSGTDVHPVLGVVKFNVRELGGDPDWQVRQTVGIMRERAVEDAENPVFRYWVESKVPSWSGVTDMEKVECVYRLVQDSIKFQRDEVTGEGIGGWESPDVIEAIIRPLDMIGYIDRGIAIGDCDDYSSLTAAALAVLGVPCSFCTVAADSRDPNQYSHVYVVAWPKNDVGERERVALDTSHGDFPGWEVPNRYGKRTEWVVLDQPFNFKVGATALVLGAGWAAYWMAKRLGVL